MELREAARTRLASLVSADPRQVGLTASTTAGCNIVLAGLGLGASDEIVTTTDEHFGLLGPLRRPGARVVVVDPEPEAIRAAVTPRTRLLAFSQVLWTTGQVLPVRELREATGVPVLVDGAQSVGAIPVEAAGLDFLTVSGQKWLCGPDSTGALVVADPERLRVAGSELFLPGRVRERTGASCPGPVRCASSRAGGRPRLSPGFSPRSTLGHLGFRPCREIAAGAEPCWRRVSRSWFPGPARRSLPSMRRAPRVGDAAALVESLYAAGVHVREIPGTG